MVEQTKAFFAYGSETPSCGEFIEEAIKEINQNTHPVRIKSWKELSVGGNFLISAILREIESSDIFCCDVTNLNENVLFELGFAIARNKPVWIIQDITISSSFQKFKEFILLNNVGYINYTSTKNIVTDFLDKKQYAFAKPLLESIPIESPVKEKPKLLFYLKSQIDNNYNQYIVNSIEESKIPVLIDDSSENKLSPISWYLMNLTRIPATLIEFSSADRSNAQIHNAKASLLAGLSVGFRKKILFIAAQPYPSAVDYQDYLKRFTDLPTCQKLVSPFLKQLRNEAIELMDEKVDYRQYKRKDGVLQKIVFGEMLAEHESNDIYDYYVNTANDDNLVRSEYNIVVGRKGSGKTASFYYLKTKYFKDIRNQVVIFKPINFELDGLIELMHDTTLEFGKSYIIESAWKYLIYSEILRSIYLRISDKPEYSIKKEDEVIIKFVSENREQIMPDLSSRLNELFAKLTAVKGVTDQREFLSKFSEVLHSETLKKMVGLIISFMTTKGMLILLIDNLDKNWRKGSNIEATSKFILGLLGVIGRINKDLKGGNKNPVDIRMHLVIFLRSDIFKQIIEAAREPDKIEYTRLIWNDPEVLFRLIDKRIEVLSDSQIVDVHRFWSQYITRHVNESPVKEYIASSIIPRPRDLIFFINAAKNSAVAKGHKYITENDIKSAYEEYSNWAFQSILVENGVTISQLKEFFYHIVGESSVIFRDRIKELMGEAKIPNEDENGIDYFIDHLCSLSFLGIEIRKNEFHFDYGYEIDDKKSFLAKKYNSNRYKIHNAFLPYMECSDYVR
ncbi:MAG: hypothetical protein KIT80_09605 [Chitinophagaceae bacterium]|nr:hypothetical protein [Chitinophagaceae bacterium]MCW5927154.1 hypothetical protein [Chitinophagaceae bacterium]